MWLCVVLAVPWKCVIVLFPHGVDRYVIAWLNCGLAKILKATLDSGKLYLGLVSAGSNGIEP